MAGLPRDFSLGDFLNEFPDEQSVIVLARENGLLCDPDNVPQNPQMCLFGSPQCQGVVYLTHHLQKLKLYCPNCLRRCYKNRVRNGVMMSKGDEQGIQMSPITRFNGTVRGAIRLIYHWSKGQVASEVAEQLQGTDLHVSHRTVLDFFHHLNVLANEKLNNAPAMVAHPQSSVQIDEALFKGKNKAHRGRPLEQDIIPGARVRNHGDNINGPWVFGMACRDVDNELDIRMFVVDRRDELTLRPIVLRHVSPGSTIQSDELGAYLNITNWGGVNNYNHVTVTHEYNFVDPATGANTQLIEGTWKHAKHAIMHARHGVKGNTQLHPAHYWFQNKFKNCAFTAALEMVAELRPVML